MVLSYYRLREQPFGVTPGRGDLYASATHREALASLLYGIDSGLGFVALIGQPGMGKTTLIFEILRRLRDNARTIFIFQTIATPTDLLQALLIELGVDDHQLDLVQMQTKLNQILIEQASRGKRLVVIIDEAQNLDDSVLELLRMLSNFETACDKLMQIILSGQMQLKDKLAAPQLVQLRQRISIFAHLQPLSAKETSAYIDHRLRVAGYLGSALFTPAAVDLIARHSGGIPRNINNICFNALSLGRALDRSTIGADVIREVLKDLDLDALESEAVRFPPAGPLPLKQGIVASGSTRSSAGRFRAWKVAAAACCIVLPATGLLLGDRRIKSDAVRGAALRLASQRLLPQAPRISDDETSADSQPTEITPHGSPESASIVTHTDPLPAPSPAEASPSAMATAPRTRLIHVRAGQTLYSICRKRLKDLGPDCLERVQELNPSLHDLDIIQRGQKILLPVPEQ